MHDIEEQLSIIWAALEKYRSIVIPEGNQSNDCEWGDICTAMSVIAEDLNIFEIKG